MLRRRCLLPGVLLSLACTKMAYKNTAELQRAYEQRTSWRQIKVGECAVCGQKPEAKPDDEPWLEELALLAEWY